MLLRLFPRPIKPEDSDVLLLYPRPHQTYGLWCSRGCSLVRKPKDNNTVAAVSLAKPNLSTMMCLLLFPRAIKIRDTETVAAVQELKPKQGEWCSCCCFLSQIKPRDNVVVTCCFSGKIRRCGNNVVFDFSSAKPNPDAMMWRQPFSRPINQETMIWLLSPRSVKPRSNYDIVTIKSSKINPGGNCLVVWFLLLPCLKKTERQC